MQRIEHQHEIEAIIGSRNGFGAAVAEMDVRQGGDLQVALVLDVFDFQRDDLFRAAGFGQRACLFRLAAAY